MTLSEKGGLSLSLSSMHCLEKGNWEHLLPGEPLLGGVDSPVLHLPHLALTAQQGQHQAEVREAMSCKDRADPPRSC